MACTLSGEGGGESPASSNNQSINQSSYNTFWLVKSITTNAFDSKWLVPRQVGVSPPPLTNNLPCPITLSS